MTDNIAGRKKRRIQRKPPRQNPKLTKAEAEVMFIIWKNGSPITYEGIATKHREWLGSDKQRKVATVKSIVNDIKRLEKARDRKYLHYSGGKPKTYAIDDRHFVNLKRTAVILLELDKGHENLNPHNAPEGEGQRAGFEHYIFNTYGWDPSFTTARLEDARKSDYLTFQELEPGRQFINIKDRLDDDVEYFKLLVEDYYQDIQHKEPSSPLLPHLKSLLALYNSNFGLTRPQEKTHNAT